MTRIRPALLLLLGTLTACLTASARPVQVTLWISGGTGGILTAGREAPGRLGILAHIRQHEPDGFWIEVGGTAHNPPAALPRQPDAVIPNLEFFQTGGQAALRDSPLPLTLLNLDILPQYPQARVPVPPRRKLQHPDGPAVTVLGLLPADTPLRVPPPLLRPLRILPPDASLQTLLPELRAASALPVLVLPETADPADWSRRFPDIPLFIEPASANPAVIALDNGKRYRVRPGLHGRAIIRVTLVWDTLRQTYTHLHAEMQWVRAPDIHLLDLPPELSQTLTLLPHPPSPETARREFADRLLKQGQADMALIPRPPRGAPPHPASPESWRTHFFPRDFTWMRLHITAETLRTWLQLDLPEYEWIGTQTGATRILLPAPLAAGHGGATRTFRQGLDASTPPAPPTPFTARDLLLPTP